MESEAKATYPEALLAALDGGAPLAVAAAVREATDRLRSADWGLDGLDALSAKLAALAAHESPRVREAVAEAAPYLPDGVFAALVEKLRTDKSPYVRDEATRAERRRSALRRAAVKDEEHDVRVDRWYEELAKHRGARRIAQAIAAHETEYFVRRMHHEAAALYLPFTGALKKLAAAVEAPEIDRAALRAEVSALGDLFALLRHVLDDARKHAQTIEADFREESLRALVTAQAKVVQGAFPERAARIAIDVREIDPRLTAEVDAKFLKQSVGNILKNAVEAYPAGGDGPIAVRVAARTIASGTQVELVFEDQGSGMLPDQVAHAFVPFGSSKPGGTGFGLFLARKIARQIHGGDLALASVHGKGTTVTMTLPVRQESGRRRR